LKKMIGTVGRYLPSYDENVGGCRIDPEPDPKSTAMSDPDTKKNILDPQHCIFRVPLLEKKNQSWKIVRFSPSKQLK